MAQTKIKAGLFEGIIGNGTDGYFLMSNGDGTMTWSSIITNPTITSIAYPGSATAADPAGGETITVNGTGFNPGAAVTVGGTAAPAVSFVSATQITFTTPAKAAGDYDIVVTNTNTGSATFINGISYNGIPTWTTAAGSLGTFASNTTISTITLQATEPDAGTITFSITNGALPTGLSLTGANIDGTTTLETAETLYTFTVTATDDESQATPRTFTITVQKALINTENFKPHLYSGGAAGQTITGVGFQSNLMLVKRRDSNDNFIAYDTVTNDSRFTNSTAADISYAYFTPNSDGFIVNGTGGAHNTGSLVAFCFKGGGAAVSNTDGTITSSVSANQDAGFSIATYTGGGSTQTVGHGLTSAPELVIIKKRDSGGYGNGAWVVGTEHAGSGWDGGFYLNSNGAYYNAINYFFNGDPTDSVVKVKSDWFVNDLNRTYVMYCFHSVDGYQKVGSYTGNTTTRPSVNTGFRPRFLMIKRTDSTGAWTILDSSRNPSNPVDARLKANESSAESTIYDVVNFTDTGFDIISDDTEWNGNGGTYIYLAIA